jgi:hypothetical protein
MFAEEDRQVPFAVKRIFAIYDVPVGVGRGGHAHRAQEQFLMMLVGGCTAVIDDGESRVKEPVDTPTEGLYLPAGLWLELEDFTPGAVCVVLASGPYEEADYIRDYAEFVTRR